MSLFCVFIGTIYLRTQFCLELLMYVYVCQVSLVGLKSKAIILIPFFRTIILFFLQAPSFFLFLKDSVCLQLHIYLFFLFKFIGICLNLFLFLICDKGYFSSVICVSYFSQLPHAECVDVLDVVGKEFFALLDKKRGATDCVLIIFVQLCWRVKSALSLVSLSLNIYIYIYIVFSTIFHQRMQQEHAILVL